MDNIINTVDINVYRPSSLSNATELRKSSGSSGQSYTYTATEDCIVMVLGSASHSDTFTPNDIGLSTTGKQLLLMRHSYTWPNTGYSYTKVGIMIAQLTSGQTISVSANPSSENGHPVAFVYACKQTIE